MPKVILQDTIDELRRKLEALIPGTIWEKNPDADMWYCEGTKKVAFNTQEINKLGDNNFSLVHLITTKLDNAPWGRKYDVNVTLNVQPDLEQEIKAKKVRILREMADFNSKAAVHERQLNAFVKAQETLQGQLEDLDKLYESR